MGERCILLRIFIALMFVWAWQEDVPCWASEGATIKSYLDLREFGFRRSYLLHIPKGYDQSKSLPLVVALHGGFSTAKEMETRTGLSELADREGFLVTYPNGIGIFGWLQHWNAGHCCGFSMEYGVDDVGFVSEVIRQVCRDVRVDTGRIYMLGYSNGGMLAYLYAAKKPRIIAAVAGISATIGSKISPDSPEIFIDTPRAPIPVIAFHGLRDETVPYGGGRLAGPYWYASVRDSMRYWVKANHASREPVREEMMEGRVIKSTWNKDQRDKEVILYTIKDWDHTLPTKYFARLRPETDPLRNLDATEIIWEFYKTHPKSPR